jgi:predicted RNA-binding Zn-ribbon protein involved in translation (DUF1610 family)
MGTSTAHVVYECPGCEERFVDERRCAESNVFCRRLGQGGYCPSCGEIVAADELEEG